MENAISVLSYAKSLYPVVALALAAYYFTTPRSAQWFALISGGALLAVDYYVRDGRYGEPWYPIVFLIIVAVVSGTAAHARQIVAWRKSRSSR